MDVLQIIAENKINTALSEGTFDHLEGMGKPIHLESIHPSGDENFMANHLLKQNRFLPIWLEDRKQLQYEISVCLEQFRNGESHSYDKLEAIKQLNHRISGYNLRVPVDSLRLLTIPIPCK